MKSDVWSLGISLLELAIGRFPFSSSTNESSSDEDEDDRRNKALSSLREESPQSDPGILGSIGEDTLKGEGTRKGDEVEMGERRRLAKRQAARLSTAILPPSHDTSLPLLETVVPRRKKVREQQHQMSIFDLVQYIVNEPAPQLPIEVRGGLKGGRWGFSDEMREFIDATLRKEPVGGEQRKKGEVGRPTPRQLLVGPLRIY